MLHTELMLPSLIIPDRQKFQNIDDWSAFSLRPLRGANRGDSAPPVIVATTTGATGNGIAGGSCGSRSDFPVLSQSTSCQWSRGVGGPPPRPPRAPDRDQRVQRVSRCSKHWTVLVAGFVVHI